MHPSTSRPLCCLLLWVLVLSASFARGQGPAPGSPGQPYNLGPGLEYFEDPDAALSIDQVLAPGFEANFTPYTRDTLHFGITSSAYWIRFSLDWDQLGQNSSRILEFGPPKLVAGVIRGGIELYALDSAGNLLGDYRLGSLDSPREIKTLSRGFALRVDAGFGEQFIARVTSARPLRLPITLWDEQGFSEHMVRGDSLLGLQYGVLLALVIYNLFLFVTVREHSHLFYVVTIATQVAFLFLDSKHLRFFMDQFYQSNWFVDTAERMIYPLLVITALLFQRSLLRIWDHNPGLDRAVKVALAGFTLTLLLTLVPNEKVFQYLFVFLLVLTIPLAFFNNVDAIRRGNASAMIHMVAIGVFLLGAVILLLLQLWPGFPDNQFTVNAYNIGLISQALLLSLALSYRYNQLKQEKEDAQLMAINNLVRSEQIKDDLLANVSHELRTPLYGINGLADAALGELERESRDTALIAQNLELIRASGDRLTKLVNDLLEFSSAKEQSSYVKFRPVDLNSLVTLVLAVCKPLVGDKNLELRSEIEADLPLVAGDEDRLQQILVNLTSNAIKFTYSGEVVIAARLADPRTVEVSVRDTGIGIHETDHETIFKSFEKLPSRQMNASGIGLGLPLTRRMVELHRSELKLESELDVGSTFSFNLRVSADQTRSVKAPSLDKQMIRRADYLKAAAAREELPRLRSEQETTIMIVDDDEINRVVMSQQLEDYHVVKCVNGLDAITAIEESKPDLVLLDLMMPGLNGYEVCQKLRQKYSQIELPIILVTAKNHLEDLTQGFKTGANDYLAKPFHNEELRSRVENQLRLSMLHKVNEDNLRLRAQIESYAEADRELRSSRHRLQQVLESLATGFIAFELPGTIFSLNQRAAELLGTDRESLQGKAISSIFTDATDNAQARAELDRWEQGDAADPAADGYSKQLSVILKRPYRAGDTASGPGAGFQCRLQLFGSDQGTGVLFLEDTAGSPAPSQTRLAGDAVELVGFLGQAQQNMRRIGARLNLLTPGELSAHPELIDKLSGAEDLVRYIDQQLPDVSSESEFRQQLVTLMRAALHTWEITTQKSKIDLAEESHIWAVSIDEGRLRTRTFDRYLGLDSLPKVPRWREVVRTAYFVLSNPAIEPEARASLEAELQKTQAILKKAAID